MLELLRTNDAILVSFIESLLREAGIAFHIADLNISIAEGSIGAFPRRVLVADAALAEARRLMRDAGLGAELPD